MGWKVDEPKPGETGIKNSIDGPKDHQGAGHWVDQESQT